MFKKNITSLCVACLSAAFPLCAEEGTPAPLLPKEQLTSGPFTGKVVGSKVRVRVHARLDAPVVYESEARQLCAVVGEENGFYAVKPPKGTKGYVFRSFILDNVVEGDRVNVRLYPDLEAPIVTQLHAGDSVHAVVSPTNNKWMEIDLPDAAAFYIAKEYVENIGPPSLLAQKEAEEQEAYHLLRTACLFTQSQLQRPFEQIDFDRIQANFTQLVDRYPDCVTVSQQAKEVQTLVQDVYMQKKMAFLGHNAGPKATENYTLLLQKFSQCGLSPAPQAEEVSTLPAPREEKVVAESVEPSDKLFIWKPLEESLFHLWVAAEKKERATMEDFYRQEKEHAMVITGVIDSYNRPVKNCPGDFLLRADHFPVAFLYSTHVNLNKLLGKQVSLLVAPRPNNNFAFPAYYVLAVE